MFKNKIKYSLLVGSLYNVKCYYIFNVYINGEKTSIPKTIGWGMLFNIYKSPDIFEFEGKNSFSYEEYKKKDTSYTKNFAHYLYCILFFKELEDENSDINKCFAPEFKDKDGKKINDYADFKWELDGDTIIDVYFIKEAKYEILNEKEVLSYDFIGSFGKWYKDKTAEESVRICLEKIKSTNYCLTYKELLKKLNLFDVYIDGKQIKEDDKKYITPEEAQKLVLKPKLEYQKIKFLTLNLHGQCISDVEIPSYINLKYFLEKYPFRGSGNCYNFTKHEGLKFSAYGKELKEDDIIGDVIDIKIEKYYVVIIKDTDKLINKGEYVEVDNLDEFIKNFKEKKGLIGKKHKIGANFINNSFFKYDYKICFTSTLLVVVSTTEKEEEYKEEHIEKPKEESKEEKLIEKPKEEHIKEIKEEIPTDDPTKHGPKVDDQTKDDSKKDEPKGGNPTDDHEETKKTALIKQCKDLVKEIKALDSTYDKTINDSASVEDLETLKTELTTKLNELKKGEPKPKDVPENPNRTTSTNGGNNSTDGGNNGKNNKKCGNCCCRNKK